MCKRKKERKKTERKRKKEDDYEKVHLNVKWEEFNVKKKKEKERKWDIVEKKNQEKMCQ